ncbi:MAG TPA: GlsB/YeaQ/YmgE family stress response membrane protein [Chthonomonadaceae bacterium]|nr:GlsB/YeaQ/YmgE family stress response membrane protein [Chthonomonadaceae bacterium]
MYILFWIIVGIVAGALAKMVVPGEGPGGILGDLIIGILGALVGGFLFNMFGHAGAGAQSGYSWLWSILVAFVGSVVLLFIFRAVSTPRTSV